jgi:8-oxo-dGTP pyrophosphatase MutT (NUDIX family)
MSSPDAHAILSRQVIDPQLAPVVSVDADLPAVSPGFLTYSFLAKRLSNAPAWKPVLAGDGDQSGRSDVREASVLVVLQADRETLAQLGGPAVLLTRRTRHLRQHGGQISFPGGRREQTDRNASATALREAREEIGLVSSAVEILGVMPIYATVTGFQVTPVVAWGAHAFQLNADPNEVEEIFKVPLAFLMNPAHHRWHQWVMANGQTRKFLSMPWISPEGAEYFIWGATAAMLRNLYHLLLSRNAG